MTMINFNSAKIQAMLTGKDVIVSEERLKSINHFNEEDVIYCINRVNELEDALKQVQRNVSGLNGLHHFD